MFSGHVSRFLKTDSEFIERFDNFAFDQVVSHDDLDDRTRFMVILATLLGCQGIDEFRAMLPPRRAELRRDAREGKRDRLSVGGVSWHRAGVSVLKGGQ